MILWFAQSSSAGTPIAQHPRELKFSKTGLPPSEGANYRKVLKNGVVAYLVENHEFPLVNVSLLIQTGSYLDPKGKVGLAAAVAQQMRAGGTKDFQRPAI